MAPASPSGTVCVLPYTSEWLQLFQEERERIRTAIGDWILDLRHIGSTSVPGLAAKPIIDIGVAVESFEEAVRCVAPLVALGYDYRGENGIPWRHYFTRSHPGAYHLHMNESHSPDWIQTTCFRDYLVRHPQVAAEYGALKQQLARQHSLNIQAYQSGKSAFIQRVLRAALIESGSAGMPGVGGEGTGAYRIRPMDSTSQPELQLVARRMRLTLTEVLGEAAGTALYSLEWLRQRVRWHLDPASCTGQVFLAEAADRTIVGHTIVRLDADDAGTPIGLFSTTYVVPEARRRGVASRLLLAGEAWLIGHGMSTAVTATSAANVPLIQLYQKHGYAIIDVQGDMVRLARALP